MRGRWRGRGRPGSRGRGRGVICILELHAPVGVIGRVGWDQQLGLAVALGDQAARIDPVLGDEIRSRGCRSPVREALIVLGGTYAVSVAMDDDSVFIDIG